MDDNDGIQWSSGHASDMQETSEALLDETTTGPRTVLLAEDDPFVRELCCAKLRDRFRVVEADTGDQALLLLQRGDIDILVTDIHMPGALDGWALAEQARLSYPNIPVVYASSRQEDAARAVTRSLYVRKPYHPDEIIAAIQQLIPMITQSPARPPCSPKRSRRRAAGTSI